MTAITKNEIVAQLVTFGIELTESQVKRTKLADLQEQLEAAQAAAKEAEQNRARKSKGINIEAKGEFKKFREGTKQARMFALLCRPEGASMEELEAELAPWKPATIKSGFGWDMARQHGVGVKTSFDAEDKLPRYHAVLPAETEGDDSDEQGNETPAPDANQQEGDGATA